ncbi:MAG: iron reductase [Boseongicola sp. SB0664_bin_43]|uniref:Iron reductase n=1 Tax=Boseongicola sp. SB0664_bin_43 TaxID=2604844 RepID=A0A6B0XYC1_9RHOB|nr:iron reductase [Boseongicola sp. SB0664_bin_43]
MSRLFFAISPYWLWALLALPAAGMIAEVAESPSPRVFHELLHPTGEFSARFMIIALMATPLAMILKDWRGPRWLKRNRRYFGVAAFGYALAHTVFYLVDAGTLARIFGEALRLDIWTGWLAFFIFIPLAATSMDYCVRKLGPRWKVLQRWVYGAAILTLVHWAALHDWGGLGPALVHFVPLGFLQAYRVWHHFARRHQRTVTG